MGTLHPNFIVGVGGSAGALSAYKALLEAIPSKTNMAFVIISHIHPTASSELAKILSRHTKMPVMVASTTMPILRNHVYVIPPDADLLMECYSYTFKVVSPRIAGNKQVDLFLSSLAEAMAARAIGIILSGYDGDGAEGCKRIRERGGKTFAQDSAEVDGMPLSAKATGCIDFFLPLDKISDEITKISARVAQE